MAAPCATQNEVDESDAQALVDAGCKLLVEGANMPCTPEAVAVFHAKEVVFGPAKAVNAGRQGSRDFPVGALRGCILHGVFHAMLHAALLAVLFVVLHAALVVLHATLNARLLAMLHATLRAAMRATFHIALHATLRASLHAVLHATLDATLHALLHAVLHGVLRLLWFMRSEGSL